MGEKHRKCPAHTVALQQDGPSCGQQTGGAAGTAEKRKVSTLQKSAEPEEKEKEAFTKHFAEEVSPS